MSWRDIQDGAIVFLYIIGVLIGILVCVAFVALLGYLAWQGYACVQEWRAPKDFIEFLGVLILLIPVAQYIWYIWLLKQVKS